MISQLVVKKAAVDAQAGPVESQMQQLLARPEGIVGNKAGVAHPNQQHQSLVLQLVLQLLPMEPQLQSQSLNDEEQDWNFSEMRT